MPLIDLAGMRPVLMGDMKVRVERGDQGQTYVRSLASLSDVPRSNIDVLNHWAETTPDEIFIADRDADGQWRRLSYRQVRDLSRRIAGWMLDHNLSTERPVLILSGNSVNHALVALGAMTAGIAYAPVTPAYSTASSTFEKLQHVVDLITPGMIFAENIEIFANAIKAVAPPDACILATGDLTAVEGARSLDEALSAAVDPRLDAIEAAIDHDTVAKFLFTSGSTGLPKAVINTQRMICSNQVMIREAMAFLKEEPPVMVDWLPWNHTAGGNHNFGIALFNGGTLYIDDGAPTPKGIHKTVRNLMDVAPTLYFNVPKGYEMLCDHLKENAVLREKFFSRAQILQYAGASLADHVWSALESLAIETIGKKIMIITGYGSTETAPFASTTTWPVGRPGEIGLPATGLEMKLVPNAEKLELRLRGPSITPGYWRQPDKTSESFDEEGFYKIGDALKFADPEDPMKGLLFDGRVSEDFKLSTGTWVNMASVRQSAIGKLAPLVRDLVLTGLDRNHIGALLFLDFEACRKAFPELAADEDEAHIASHGPLVEKIRAGLQQLLATSTGSSTLIQAAIIMPRSPNPVLNEITDKGSINQRAVGANNPHLVDDLYAADPPAHVLTVSKKG